MENVIQRVVRLLKEQNKQDKELCDHIGVAQSTFVNWKKRNTDPKSRYISDIADFFGVSEKYLLNGEDKEWQPTLSEKEEKELDKKVEDLLGAVTSDTGLMLDGEIMDDETREIFAMNLRNALKTTKLAAKSKYTPDKHKK